jgi:hypothetical protein
MNGFSPYERKKIEALLVKRTRISANAASRLSDMDLAVRTIEADGRRIINGGSTAKVAARKWELECEGRRIREAAK